MASVHREMAASMAALMKNASFSQPLVVKDRYLPTVKVSNGDLDELRCDIVPSSEGSSGRSSRSTWMHEYKFRLGFRKKIDVAKGDAEEAELDKITVVVEEVLEFWKQTKPQHSYGYLASFETITPVDLAELEANRIAVCELELAFHGSRELK